jgi:hypothetical protein
VELALTVRANGPEAFEDLLHLDEQATYTPRMQAAYDGAAELERSFETPIEVARRCRCRAASRSSERSATEPEEIADCRGRELERCSVLFDLRSGARSAIVARRIARSISPRWLRLRWRRHPAAAGCEMPDLWSLVRAPPASASRTS